MPCTYPVQHWRQGNYHLRLVRIPNDDRDLAADMVTVSLWRGDALPGRPPMMTSVPWHHFRAMVDALERSE